MIKCTHCDLENPSKANFCFRCGAPLGEGILSEDVLLKKNLEHANATIEVLKKSLISAQKKLEECGDGEELKSLRSQINEKKTEIETRDKRILELNKLIEDLRSSKKGRWGWIFVVLSLAAICGAGILWSKMNSETSYLNSVVYRLESENSTLADRNSELESQYETLRSQMNDDTRKLEKIVSVYPLIITDLEIANTDYDRNIETDYGYALYSYRTMYLTPRIKYNGLKSTNLTFKVKWYNPDGTLRRAYSSPSGCTQSISRQIYEGENQLEFIGWGNSTPGNYWDKGTYRLEIWVGDVCLKSKTFTIY